MREDLDTRLRALWEWVGAYDRQGKTRRQFWEEFGSQAGDLEQLVWADDADEALREHYTEILVLAGDLGYEGPDEAMDEVME